MSKPIIGIIPNMSTIQDSEWSGLKRTYVVNTYLDAIERAGGIPVVLPFVKSKENMKPLLDMCNGILATGGQDIHPIFFNEQPHKGIGDVYYDIDKFQIEFTKLALENNKSFLGICKGHQILNVACGGSLYQDLSKVSQQTISHYQKGSYSQFWHKIRIESNSILSKLYGKEIWVNSYHHQSIKNLGKGLRVISTTYDGVIEAVEMDNDNFVVGVQFHPELMIDNEYNLLYLFEEFVNSCSM